MAHLDKGMEDKVKRITDELRHDAQLVILMELIVSLAFKLKDHPHYKREAMLSRTITAIRKAWAKEH